ncbi:ABC transporter ATP-binding protein [Amnibacterium kyonggiense]|uniref:ABC-type multidrug transport system ATPase subunit n=1 Tax=Amnibacterium kyonggiense TaxID=595671 RepID=A0A4R7FSU3_9MICO|nr:ABC transporter ATP-binding protein [Amnibacterium kyonggiense]TDS80749.1 ABC-type multidrug transport system ATPase subunit [Amnibacterium kyonggiense]
MDPAGLVVEGVRRSFGSTHAVRDMTFSAAPGRVTGLIGPNGSGKTTLLLMLATLLAPDAGSIRIGGLDPVRDPVGVRSIIGWMPDVLGSWSALTTRATLELTGRLYGLPKPRAAARAAELIELVHLGDLADQPTRVLSRGQKQRMSLARALVHDPAVLLLDEPASGLDPEARVDLRVLVRALAAEGRTVLVSSHVLAELEEMADDAVYVQAGATVDPDRVEALRDAPRLWRVRAEDPGALDAALAGRDDVTADHLGRLVPVRDEGGAADLLAALVRDGVRVVAFAPAAGDMERTFLELTRESRA